MSTKREEKLDEAPAAEVATAGTERPEAAGSHEAQAEHKKGHGRKEKALDEELARVKEEAELAKAAVQDRLVRLQADFENFRKRTVRDRAELIRTSNEELVSELLPVVDHLELALEAVQPAAMPDALQKGVKLVLEQLVRVLGKFGLQSFEAAGQPFDPARHEAISHLPSDTVMENVVMTQTRRGYVLGDKLIRPAQVVVSSGKPGTDGVPSFGGGADAGE